MEQHLAVAERFIAANFPRAEVAVVAGSTATGNRTASSDIDLLLIGDDLFDDGRTSLARGFRSDGEFLEVFAYTTAGFREWAERGIAQHRPVILHMLVDGVELRGGPSLAALREQWGRVLDAGASPTPHELALRRYVITDQLDDLRDATDPLERRIIAALLFERTAELMLLTAGRWIGAGKYLPRRLREWDRARADALAAPLLDDDLPLFIERVESELVAAGGRLQEDFTR